MRSIRAIYYWVRHLQLIRFQKEDWKILERKIDFISKIITNLLFQQKLLRERRRFGNVGMEEENQLLRENVRNIADNMRLAAYWNVGFVGRTYQGEDGTAVLNKKRRFGSVLNLQRTEKDFVRIVRVYQSR